MDDQIRTQIQRFLRDSGGPRSSDIRDRIGVATAVGSIRERNEDAAAALSIRYSYAPGRDFDLALVCDGLGGMQRGREAAILGLSTFASSVIGSKEPSLLESAKQAIAAANVEVFRLLRGFGGTTLTAVLVPRSGAPVIAHAGDSRAYGYTQGQAPQLLTKDDTLNAVLNKPAIEAERDSRLVQFVGLGPDLEPHVFAVSERFDTGFILASDGAYDVAGSTFYRAISAAKSGPDIARRLVLLSDLLGGLDNATAVFLEATLMADRDPVSDGVTVQLLGAAGELKMWLGSRGPAQLNTVERESLPDQTGSNRIAIARENRRKGEKRGPRARTTKPRKRGMPKGKAPEPELDLGHDGGRAIDVVFPTKDGTE